MSQLIAEKPAAAERYATDGVVLLPQLLSADEIDEIRTVFTQHVETDRSLAFDDNLPADDILAKYPRFVHPHRHPDVEAGRLARRMMTDPRIFAVVEDLIGPAYGAQSMFYFKPPTARGQAFHQDNLFLQAHPETCLAAWIAIDDCDAENGGLLVIPGSHQIQILCPEEADQADSFTGVTVPVPTGATQVQTQMRAGDVLFFHGSMVHGSRPNTSANRFRRSLIFHYIPQASVEVAKFYLPLLTSEGAEVAISAAAEGGPCGTAWTSEG